MSDYAAGWLDRLRPELAAYARAALDNIGQEFPSYASLAYVTGDGYMVEHWLAAYAVLLFS